MMPKKVEQWNSLIACVSTTKFMSANLSIKFDEVYNSMVEKNLCKFFLKVASSCEKWWT